MNQPNRVRNQPRGFIGNGERGLPPSNSSFRARRVHTQTKKRKPPQVISPSPVPHQQKHETKTPIPVNGGRRIKKISTPGSTKISTGSKSNYRAQGCQNAVIYIMFWRQRHGPSSKINTILCLNFHSRCPCTRCAQADNHSTGKEACMQACGLMTCAHLECLFGGPGGVIIQLV